jgi:SAM-dependent methyltransferase
MPTTTLPPLDRWVPEKISRDFGERFADAHARIETYTRRAVRELLPKLLGGELRPFTMAELSAAASAVEQAGPLLEWTVRFLETFGDVRREGDRFVADFAAPLPPLAEIRAEALALEPSAAAAYAIVDRCSEGASDFVSGKVTGEAVLFALSALNLWFDYFSNQNYLYEINNRLAALVLADELAKRPATDRAPRRRVTEFGGGSGSAALALLDEVESRGGSPGIGGPVDYVFTELIAAFLRRGERAIKGRLPEGWTLAARSVDLEKPLTEQGFEEGSLAAAWALNTFHVVRDLEDTLGRALRLLEPGGALVLGECIRPFPDQVLYTEFVFDFLTNFRDVKTGPNRSGHGFLTPEEWKRSFEAAGFIDVRIVPDILELRDVYPKFFTAAVVGRKPGGRE